MFRLGQATRQERTIVDSDRWWRRATLLVVVIALVNAGSWAVLTPLFQGPDEIVHYGYAERVAETGRPPAPVSTGAATSEVTTRTLDAVPWSPIVILSWDREASDRFDGEQVLRDRRSADRTNPRSAGYQAENPPLYAYVMAVPYLAAKATGATVEGRLMAMRLVTALIGALAVFFVVRFLRELLPNRPLPVILGGLAVALQPVYGWLAGTVNNDLAVVLGGAILLYGIARAFRRGLDLRTGLVMGAGVAIGLLSKVSAYGLLAVAAWSVLWLLVAQRHRLRHHGRRIAIGIVALFVLAVVPWYVVQELREGTNALADASNAAAVTGAAGEPSGLGKVADFLSYLWQFYLPRLPFMDDQFVTSPQYGLWEIWIQSFMGRFGWFQFGFTPGQSWTMLGVLVVAVSAAGVGLWRMRALVRRRWTVLVALVGGFAGYVVMVHIKGWQYQDDTGQNFEQVRYLFPMIGLYGLLIAVALIGFPRRWRKPVAAGVVLLMLVHLGASWALTFQRFYL